MPCVEFWMSVPPLFCLVSIARRCYPECQQIIAATILQHLQTGQPLFVAFVKSPFALITSIFGHFVIERSQRIEKILHKPVGQFAAHKRVGIAPAVFEVVRQFFGLGFPNIK